MNRQQAGIYIRSRTMWRRALKARLALISPPRRSIFVPLIIRRCPKSREFTWFCLVVRALVAKMNRGGAGTRRRSYHNRVSQSCALSRRPIGCHGYGKSNGVFPHSRDASSRHLPRKNSSEGTAELKWIFRKWTLLTHPRWRRSTPNLVSHR